MSLTLLDWRRQVSALYAEIRSSSDHRGAHEHWREVRDGLFRHHPDSPLLPEARDGFEGLPIVAYDPSHRYELELDCDLPAARLEIPTGTDGIVTFDRIGRLRLPEAGGTEAGRTDDGLDVWWLASYGGGIFVPIKDTLAGRATYGGGRYLIDTVKGADLGGRRPTSGKGSSPGTLVVDFNFAYNPSCAYDPAWACPLAPPGNALRQPVMAGELTAHRWLPQNNEKPRDS